MDIHYGWLLSFLFFFAAKKFGVNEFVNPKDHDKPVQQVSILKLLFFFFKLFFILLRLIEMWMLASR